MNMQALKKQVIVLLGGGLLATLNLGWAESDVQMYEQALRAREMKQHANHADMDAPENGAEFRGVYYGFLPCSDCDGLKMTLSLKQSNNYLLVSQYARASSREDYEKGKYSWDEQARKVVLTPRNKSLAVRQFHIEDDATLIQLNADGAFPDNKDSYALRRADTMKSRQVHIH
jgi:NlpE N-terminal domain